MSVLMNGVHWTGEWCVIEDLVPFTYSVKLGCKFHWLLGSQYAPHPTGTMCSPSSAHRPSQVIAQPMHRWPWCGASLEPSLIRQPTLITTQVPLFQSVMTCHSLDRTQETLC